MLKAVCQNTLPFHSHRDITARFDGGASHPTQDGCCLDRWIVNIDWGYDSNGAKSNAKGCRLVSLAVSVQLRGGPRPSRSGTYRRG